jgi:hypothetical protein
MQALSKVDNWQARNAFFEQVKREVRRSFPQMRQYGQSNPQDMKRVASTVRVQAT